MLSELTLGVYLDALECSTMREGTFEGVRALDGDTQM